jgi:ribosomal protein S18 acetylase RimI-like enzyme
VAIYRDNRSKSADAEGEVVGAIRARLEDEITVLKLPPTTIPHSTTLLEPEAEIASSADSKKHKKRVYLQTLLLLSPYRHHGIASSLLTSLLTSIHSLDMSHLNSDIEIVSVQAHVHETNEEALQWYVKRGFTVQEEVEGYYRRLKPSGARLVRMALPGPRKVEEEERETGGEVGEENMDNWERLKRKRGEEKGEVG